MKKKRKKRVWILICFIIGIPLFLLYGPFNQFRIMLINTAMNTSHYEFVATTLFTQKYIHKVMDEHRITTDKKTDADAVQTSERDTIDFAEINGDYYKGYIIKIDDPSRVDLTLSDTEAGELVEDLVQSEKALGGINASGYASDENRGELWGYCVKDGTVVNECHICAQHSIAGMDQDNKLIVGNFKTEELSAYNFKWAVEFGPVLVVNGEKTKAEKFSGGIQPRTAIGQTESGEILLLVVDGRQTASIGATFADLQTVLYANGAYNAVALDGGSSSSMVMDGEVVNVPSDIDQERMLPNAIIFK